MECALESMCVAALSYAYTMLAYTKTDMLILLMLMFVYIYEVSANSYTHTYHTLTHDLGMYDMCLQFPCGLELKPVYGMNPGRGESGCRGVVANVPLARVNEGDIH